MAIITISRGTFSGGKAVAEALGKRLGYPCLSKEIVLDAVEEFGVPEEKLVAALEEPPKAWTLKPSRRIAHLNYVRYALLKAARNGEMVYHGYAGHLLLSGIPRILRIRVITDMENRINSAMTRDNLSRQQAISMIEKMDKQSSNWTSFLYGIDWNDPSLYDVVVNLEFISIESAVEIIEKMVSLKDFETTVASKKAFDDQLLSSLVWAALTKEKATATANVRVSSDDGNVTIAGSVGSESMQKAVGEVAMRVAGVKQVKNEVGIGSDWHW
ncbi:MAG: cytidylate kinase family protein [Deltaproteobacteria bacterium]|nr:cytidylate kinase family protein [Deltaproteobacteria bacterium]